VPVEHRELLLRFLFTGSMAERPVRPPPLDETTLRRLVDWLKYGDALSGKRTHRCFVPKSVAAELGSTSDNIATFVADIAIGPLHRLDTTGDAAWPAYANLTARELAPLRDLVEARRLTGRHAARLFHYDGGRFMHPPEAAWWFTTASPLLDLSNALVCGADLLRGEVRAWWSATKLPRRLVDRWSLRAKDVPHFMEFCAVVVMAIDGVIDIEASSSDPCGLREAVPALQQWIGQRKHSDVAEACAMHRAGRLAPAEDESGSDVDAGGLGGRFGRRRRRPRQSLFAPYYAAMRTTADDCSNTGPGAE
jgi:hypothetical protein